VPKEPVHVRSCMEVDWYDHGRGRLVRKESTMLRIL
jgi:hypothetical protein